MSERLDVKQRVVVIDDDPGFRLLLSNMLEELEYAFHMGEASPESLLVIKFTIRFSRHAHARTERN